MSANRTEKVRFKKMSIKTIVEIAEPRPPKTPAYEFSNGRKFYRKEER